MNPYDMDETMNEMVQKEAIFNTQVDVQVLLQILIDKGICTREEINVHRNRVRQLPKYKATANYIEQTKNMAEYYKANPEQQLKDILKAKMEGKIK
jgi:adenylate kinase family enzyme